MRQTLTRKSTVVEILDCFEDIDDDIALRFPDRVSAEQFMLGFLTNESAMRKLREFHSGAVSSPVVTEMSDHDVLERLAAELFAGRLLITFEAPGETHSLGVPGEETQSDELGPEIPGGPRMTERVANNQSWIGISLVDDEDRPVPDERYEITLPDASVVRGRTDGDGTARHERIESGTCHITFPDLDRRSWVAIG